MTPKKDIKEFVKELDERLRAVSYVQQMIVALIVGASPYSRKMIRDAIAKTLDHISDKEPNAKTLQNELKKYIAIINQEPPPSPGSLLRLIPGGGQDQDNESQ